MDFFRQRLTPRPQPEKRDGVPPGCQRMSKLTSADERWMAERLEALEDAWGAAPPGHRRGNIPQAGGLPPGLHEEEPPPTAPGDKRPLRE